MCLSSADIIDCGEGWLFDTILRRCVGRLYETEEKKKDVRESNFANLPDINKECANKKKNVYGRVCVRTCR